MASAGQTPEHRPQFPQRLFWIFIIFTLLVSDVTLRRRPENCFLA